MIVSTRSKNAIRALVIALAILFVVLGVFRKEVKVVFNKAKAICFACIGLD